jgi:hypothetical protein
MARRSPISKPPPLAFWDAAVALNEAEDIAEALSYAVWRAEEVELPAAPAVKLLVDMSLSPSWAERLASHRFEAAHWSTVVLRPRRTSRS